MRSSNKFLFDVAEVSVAAAKTQPAVKRQGDPKAVYAGMKKSKNEDGMTM